MINCFFRLPSILEVIRNGGIDFPQRLNDSEKGAGNQSGLSLGLSGRLYEDPPGLHEKVRYGFVLLAPFYPDLPPCSPNYSLPSILSPRLLLSVYMHLLSIDTPFIHIYLFYP